MRKQILTGVLALGLFIQASITSFAETVEIKITQNPKIDIILTTQDKTFEFDKFESDLKETLSEKGMDNKSFNFTTVERSYNDFDSNGYSPSDIYNMWQMYPNPNATVVHDGMILNDMNVTINSGQKAQHRQSFMYKEALGHDYIEISADMLNHGCVAPSGLIVNYDPDKDLAYIVAVGDCPGSGSNFYSINTVLYKVPNFSKTCVNDGKYLGQGVGTALAQVRTSNFLPNTEYNKTKYGAYWYNKTSSPFFNIKAVVNETGHLDVYLNEKLALSYELGEDSHGYVGIFFQCVAAAKNVSLTTKFTKVKSYKDVLTEPTWREDAEHIIINIDNNIDDSFTDTTTKGEILTRTINDNIGFIQWGDTTNEVEMENFIKQNNNNGIFIVSSNYEKAVLDTANYIANKYKIENFDEQIITVNTALDIDVTPENLKSNTINAEYPNGKWIVHHDYKYYENNQGQYENADVYMDAIPDNILFDKVGKYDIYFADEMAKTIYVHRKPVADFNVNLNSDKTVNFTSTSYDLDSNVDAGLGNGITEEKWQYKNINDENWMDGKPNASLKTGESYIFQLSVKDQQDTWSSPVTKFITLNTTIKLQPIAQFDYENQTIFINKNLIINDTSYDPAGKTIIKKEWTLKKDNKEIGIYNSPITDFKELGTGNYAYTLKVTNSDGSISESYTKSFSVIADNKNPIITIDPTYCNWEESQKINIEVEDLESGLNKWRYCYTQSQNEPLEEQWNTWTTNEFATLTLNTDGEYYLHVQALDNEGNTATRTVGTYKITHPYTNKIVHDFGIYKENEFKTYDWGKWYNPANEFMIKIKGFEGKDAFLANYPNINTIYSKEDRIKQPSNIVEYTFFYNPITYTATLDYGYDEKIEIKTFTVVDGFKLEKPERENYEFIGWYINGKLVEEINYNLDNEFTNFKDFKDVINKRYSNDITIIAKWNQVQFTEGTNVFATIASEYSITIPKTVVLSGQSKSAKYFVKVQGDIGGQEEVSVVPDENFNLNTKGKDGQNATVTQDKTSWKYDNFNTDANGTITAPAITAGKWLGTFNFNIDFNGNTDEASSEESIEYQTIEYPTSVTEEE